MNSRDPSARQETPIAIVGIAGIYPGAGDLDEFWTVLAEGRRGVAPVEGPGGWCAARIERPAVDLSRFGIPPIFARSVGSVVPLLLHAVDRSLAAGTFSLPRERTDVLCGTSFAPNRVVQSSLRIDAIRFLDRLERLLAEECRSIPAERIAQAIDSIRERSSQAYGGAFNDKLYETAASMAAQISIAFGLKGRSLCLDAAGLTSFACLKVGLDNLRAGACDAAIVGTAQLLDGPHAFLALEAKRLLARHPDATPFRSDVEGLHLGEGVGVVVLKRLEDALAGGDQIRAVVRGVGLAHGSEHVPFRYGKSVEARVLAIRRALAEAGPGGVDYVECFGSGVADDTARELAALREVYGGAGDRPVRLGCVKELIGHTFANAGLASLTKVVLSLTRGVLPGRPHRVGPTVDLGGPPFELAAGLEPWPPGPDGRRRAAIGGSSLGGGHAHVLVEDFVPGRTAARTRPAEPRGPEPSTAIAIVGMGACFGGGRNVAEIGSSILAGQDWLRPLPDEILPRRMFFDPTGFDPMKSYTETASPVDVPPIDPDRYRIVRGRLEAMDAAQRLALATTTEALEDYGLDRLARSRPAAVVLAGSSLTLRNERRAGVRGRIEEYRSFLQDSAVLRDLGPEARARVEARLEEILEMDWPTIGPYTLDGFLASGIPILVSNAFGLDAPGSAVQAACASAVAAIDIACRSLARRDVDLALAGGVELGVNHYDLVLCSRMRLLSPDRITPFDAAADGFSIGEGGAFFVLKRLEESLADGDRIHAVIRGIGTSSDARSMVAPDPGGQALAMRRAFASVDFAPDAIDFIETHGTGTELGDRVEVESIRAVYATGLRERPLVLGSIKSMIGHTMAAAGAAGLLKAVLALESGTFPPNANLEQVHPDLGLEHIPARIPTSPSPWPAPPGAPRRAALSSFGTGGINYHLLLEAAPAAGAR